MSTQRSFILDPQPNYKKILRYELSAGVAQDLYEKNYSTVKSNYGTDLLGDGTYTGDETISTEGSPVTTYYTDTGEVLVDDGIYRCTRSSLLLSSIDTIGASISTAITEDSDEWLSVESEDYLSRYVKSDIDATITVEVGDSLITSDITETDILVRPFPSWMELRSDQDSVGYKLMNVIADEIEKFKFQAISFPQRGFINEIPEGIKSHAYLCTTYVIEHPIDVVGTSGSPAVEYVLSPAESLTEFIEAEETKHLYYKDGFLIFTCGEYDTLEIDGVEFPQEKVHVYNAFDHIGASLDLERLPDEENSDYKDRILDVYTNLPGASWGRIQAAIERESGVTISEIYELNDGEVPWTDAHDPTEDGLFYQEATDEHLQLADWCNKEARVGFDFFKWGRMLWDLYPHPWDLAEVPYLLDDIPDSGTIEPGIGYGEDLKPYRYEHKGSFPYSVEVRARGWVRDTVTVYPPVTVTGRVVPSGTQTMNDNGHSGFITIEFTTEGPIVYAVNVQVTIPPDYGNVANTNMWKMYLPQFNTSQTIDCCVKSDTLMAPVQLTQSDIIEYNLVDGSWDFANQTYVDNDPADKFSLGFTDSVDSTTWDVVSEGSHPKIVYADCHTLVGDVLTPSWEGEGAQFVVSCNPDMEEETGSVSVPLVYPTTDYLGTVTYTLVVDAVYPEGASYSIEFSNGTSTITDFPTETDTIDLTSSYETSSDRLVETYGGASQIFSGTLTSDNPIAIEEVASDDFSLPAGFEGGKYECKVNGRVYTSMPADLDDTANLVIELDPVFMLEWEPLVLPGTVYLSGQEYYQHADEEEETVTGTEHTLSYPIADGTIITNDGGLTELHFTDDDGVPTLDIVQTIYGNGTNYLPLWYSGAKDITVDGDSKSLLSYGDSPYSTSESVVDYGEETDEDTTYTVEYRVENSFCVDYLNIENGEFLPKLTFESDATGVKIQYTPYNTDGYGVDTGQPTNPLFTTKNRDFLYLDDEEIVSYQIQILTQPYTMWRGEDNLLCARVTDSDGNGVYNETVSFSTDDSQNDEVQTDIDGYAYTYITGHETNTDVTVTASFSESPAVEDEITYTLLDYHQNKPEGLYCVSQAYQVARVGDSLEQTIKVLVLDEDGSPVTDESGLYTYEEVEPTSDTGTEVYGPELTNYFTNPNFATDTNDDGQADGVGIWEYATLNDKNWSLENGIQRFQSNYTTGDSSKWYIISRDPALVGTGEFVPGDPATFQTLIDAITVVGCTVELGVYSYTEGGSYVATTEGTSITEAGEYSLTYATLPATTGALEVAIVVSNWSAGDSIDISFGQWIVTKTDAAVPYFDGNSSRGSWDGTEDASTSTKKLSGRLMLPELTNLCTNPKPVHAAASRPAGWDKSGTLVFSDGAVYDGITSKHIKFEDGTIYAFVRPKQFSVDDGIVPGETYTFSQVMGEATITDCTLRLYVSWQDSGGNAVGGSSYLVISPGEQFERVTLSAVAPAGAARVQFLTQANGDFVKGDILEFSICQVLVEKSPYVTPYFDGDSDNCAWTGTPDASTSTRTASSLLIPYTQAANGNGTIAARISPLYASTDGNWHAHVMLSGAAKREVGMVQTGNAASMGIEIDATVEANKTGLVYSAGDLLCTVIRWINGGDTDVDVNGLTATDASPANNPDAITHVRFGEMGVTGRESRAYIGPVVLSPRYKLQSWVDKIQADDGAGFDDTDELMHNYCTVGDMYIPFVDDSVGLLKTGGATYEIWCSDEIGCVDETPLEVDENGFFTLQYTPTVVGQYVLKVTYLDHVEYIGWCLVERF